MNIQKILQESNIPYSTYEKIQAGKDSTVYKVIDKDGKLFAVRILPLHRLPQFQWETELITLVREQQVPAPTVVSVQPTNEHAVMLMEWAKGMTMLQALIDYPNRSRKLGQEFGKVQGMIHQINMPEFQQDTWLTPASAIEKELIDDIQAEGSVLLHLDYHPLNVMTDGETITAVIDWINAASGDRRFDLIRTQSIMEIDGPTLPELREVLPEFLAGWREGYEMVGGPMQLNDSFRLWAGNRMKRDVANRLDEGTLNRINHWMGETDE